MSTYKHLLLGLDLSPESQQVVDRVKSLFFKDDLSSSSLKISVCHILEPLAFTYGGDIPVDLSDVQLQLEEQARSRLAGLASQLNVAEENQHVILGQAAREMHRIASEEEVDLIVVGSHGRHGLALIFGSTSNSVLHGANCDVLAVRIAET